MKWLTKNKNKCVSCKWFNKTDEDLQTGQCHLNPPQVLHFTFPKKAPAKGFHSITEYKLPVVHETSYCSHWKDTDLSNGHH